MTTPNGPRILEGCEVLPPMEPDPPAALPSEPSEPAAPERVKEKPARRKTGERFAVLNALVDFGMANLRPVEQAVWFVLWRDTKPNGLASSSQLHIARRIGMSDRTVRRAIDRLKALGFLQVTRQGGIRQGPTRYRVMPLPKEDRTTK